MIAVLMLLAACTPAATQAPAPAATQPPAAAATEVPMTDAMTELIAAAQAEGMLSTIALPRDWCNYGEVIDSFTAKYGLEYNGLLPDGGSGDEIEAIKANQGNTGPQAPDVIDVGFAFGPSSQAEGLLLPYMVSTWDTIPDDAKDPEGYWYGDYYGVMSFMVNTDIVENVPQDWADLLKPEYESMVALSGDPRVSNQAIQAVFASSLANGGTLDNARPGLDFFADVNSGGNFVPLVANNGLVAKGEVPVRITWDYNALAGRDSFFVDPNDPTSANPPVDVVIPATGRFGGVYVQAISAYAPHPNAAKLWMEYLYSDEGQILWMKGYCHPIREADLRARGVIPEDILAKLPDVSGAVFPTVAQLDAAKALITTNWDAVVGANVVTPTPGP
jgi:putative spermidine/putrescine transport system substrate-binding protein